MVRVRSDVHHQRPPDGDTIRSRPLAQRLGHRTDEDTEELVRAFREAAMRRAARRTG